MNWDFVFLGLAVAFFVAGIYMLRWGSEIKNHFAGKDSWKFPNPGGGV